jgi:hypothetical protein
LTLFFFETVKRRDLNNNNDSFKKRAQLVSSIFKACQYSLY